MTLVKLVVNEAKSSFAGLVVVVAGIVSAVAALTDLTHWVSITAAVVAVLAGLRVIQTDIVVPVRLDIVRRATVRIYSESPAGRVRGTAVHIGSRLWITAAHVVDGFDSTHIVLPDGDQVVRVLSIDERRDIAIVGVDHDWAWHVNRDDAVVDAGDTVKVFGWRSSTLQRGLGLPISRRRLSVSDMVVDGLAEENQIVLAGHVPTGFGGGPVVDIRTGKVLGLVVARAEATPDGPAETFVTRLDGLDDMIRESKDQVTSAGKGGSGQRLTADNFRNGLT
jgi:Trypsin-like peptidase domain